jgi:hypothetical protein
VLVETLISAKNKYLKVCANIKKDPLIYLQFKYFEAYITILTPVCPCMCYSLSDMLNLKENWDTSNIFNISDNYDSKYLWQNDILNNVASECNSLWNKRKDKDLLCIKVFKSFSIEELEIINNVNILEEYLASVPKEKYGKYKGFGVYVKKCIDKYGNNWKHWVTNIETFELDMLTSYLSLFISIPFVIEFVEPNEKGQFRAGPGSPIVTLTKSSAKITA